MMLAKIRREDSIAEGARPEDDTTQGAQIHNFTAEPLSEEINFPSEDGKLGPKAGANERSMIPNDKFDWNGNDARKIRCWDPDAEGANQQDDTTQGVQIHCKLSEEALAAFIAHHEQHAEDLCSRAVGGGHQRSVREAW